MVHQDAAKERLLDAAERLLAVHGFAAATSRAITELSGHRNKSAITYHFGSRQALTDAVWLRGVIATAEHLKRTFDEVDGFGRGCDADRPGALVRAWATPLVAVMQEQMSRSGTPSTWARFCDSWLDAEPPDVLDTLGERLVGGPPQLMAIPRALDRLRQVTAGGAEPEASARLDLVVRFVVSAAAAWERDVEAGRLPVDSLTCRAEQLVALATAMVELPPVRAGVASSRSVVRTPLGEAVGA